MDVLRGVSESNAQGLEECFGLMEVTPITGGNGILDDGALEAEADGIHGGREDGGFIVESTEVNGGDTMGFQNRK